MRAGRLTPAQWLAEVTGVDISSRMVAAVAEGARAPIWVSPG